eukprot:TRINITY_DN61459_c0_g1_i1.p1 TRINITY_DN61459_c0_g1~~TRINITY_DN61459_c0_g1_i1.p1  ORF type:complete len:425 (+),score=59.94 TRINITY_DN61459_c0_g1_i1:101-1276(+)
MLAIAALAGCASSDSSLRGSRITGARDPASWTRQPVIIDTDMDTDDMMAIAYLLAEPTIEVKAISVLADGWSHQWSGVVNAMRLTQFFGQPSIPVAYSPKYNSDTQLSLKEPSMLPRPSLLTGIDNFLSEFVPLPFNERPPSWMYGPRLVRETLRESSSPIDIIELGPLTTLAQVLQEEPELFRKKVRTLYFSGGEVASRTGNKTDKVWPYSAGDASAGATSFTGKPPGDVSWNVFSDPIAANSVFSFGLDVVFATGDYHNGLHFYLNDTRFIPHHCEKERVSLLHDLVLQLPAANGEAPSKLRYWDEGTAVLATQMIRNHGGNEQAAVCTKFNSRQFAVMMEAGDNATISGGRYGRLLENQFGQPARQCLQADETEFKIAYFMGVCGSLH